MNLYQVKADELKIIVPLFFEKDWNRDIAGAKKVKTIEIINPNNEPGSSDQPSSSY